MVLCLSSSLCAQTLTGLGVRIPGGNLNSVIGFNASTYTYTVNLSSTQTLLPTVEATPASGSTAVVTNATSITGTQAERTATVVVTAGSSNQTYTVTFIKSTSYIQGFTEEIAPSTYQADGTYNNGQQLGNRSCRTTTSSNSVYWTLPTLVNGAGKISLYISKDYGTSNLLSTLQIKKSADGGTNWSTVASIDASTYAFPTVGTWQKVEYDLNINSATAMVQINVIKTGTTRDFMIDDIVITPYSTTTSLRNIDYPKENVSVYASNKTIHIEANQGNSFCVFDLYGRIVKEGIYTNPVNLSVSTGIYFVKANSIVSKVIVK